MLIVLVPPLNLPVISHRLSLHLPLHWNPESRRYYINLVDRHASEDADKQLITTDHLEGFSLYVGSLSKRQQMCMGNETMSLIRHP